MADSHLGQALHEVCVCHVELPHVVLAAVLEAVLEDALHLLLVLQIPARRVPVPGGDRYYTASGVLS